jgi:hypothetical protein
MEKGPSALLIGPRESNGTIEQKPRHFSSLLHDYRVGRFRVIYFTSSLETSFAE